MGGNFGYSSSDKHHRGERGNAALIAMIFLAFAALTILTIMAANNMRENRNLDKSRIKLHEKWEARSGANTLAQIVAQDAPTQADADVRWARSTCGVSPSLPVFDDENLTTPSTPAVIFNGTTPACTDSGSPAATSIFGTIGNWRNARIPLFESTGQNTFALDANNVKVIQLDEIYRRSMGAADVAYAVRYIVEAKNGNYRTRTNGEIILGANLPSCGTSVELQANPSSLVSGNSENFSINYASANHLKIYNSSNILLHDEVVTEQSANQNFVYNFAPAATDSYYVTATSSAGCAARSANVTITVTAPPPTCPTITNFSASSSTINSGDTVSISWVVQNAATVNFEGANVSLTGSQNFTLTADRTFTLTASQIGCADVVQQITVTVRPTPPCGLSAPQIQSYVANPASIAIGASSTLTWNVNGLAAGGTITLTGANGLNQAVGASGSLNVSPPSVAGDYTYQLTAQNVCPDGTQLTTQSTVVITVRACPPPAISAFTVNPAAVTQFGSQRITFAWNISGTTDAVSISNGVGGGLPASGTIDVNQPNVTTTYTLTAVGCGNTQQAQVVVTVNTCPTPSISSFSANPLNVFIGANQIIRLSWITGGTIDSLNIAGIGNVAGSYVDILQPQSTTTYLLTATGCSTSSQANTTINAQSPPLVANSSCTGNSFDAALINPDSNLVVFRPSSLVAVQRNAGNPTMLDISITWTGLNPDLNNGSATLTAYDAVVTIPGVQQFQVQASGEDSINHSFVPPNRFTASTTEARNGGMTITLPWDGTSINQIDISGNFYGTAYSAGNEKIDINGNFGGTSSCP